MADISLTASIDILSGRALRDVEAFARRADRSLGAPLGRMAKSADEFQKSMAAANARVLAFGASAGVIFGVERALTGMAKAAIDVEKRLTDINVILNLSNKNITSFGAALFDVAKKTGQSFKVVADAATELSRQGLGVEQTLKRTRDALILSRLTGLQTTEAVEDLTAAINSFSGAALDSTTIINKLAAVDASFAVSSRDLADAIKRVGSTAEDTGVQFDSLLALITSVQQTTARGGAVIGNAFKTIFQRLGRSDTLDFLERFQIQVRDAYGEALTADKILINLARTYDNLSAAQQNQVVQLSAGVFQANVFRAILRDLSKETSFYTSSLNVANNATDEAIKRNEQLNKTFSALFNEFKQNLTQFGAKAGELTLTPVLSNTTEGLNTILSQLNSEGVGQDLGKGILKGIGAFISGPGTVAVGLVFAKLVKDLITFGAKSFKTFLNINTVAREHAILEERILVALKGQQSTLANIASLRGRGGAFSSFASAPNSFQAGVLGRTFTPTSIPNRSPFTARPFGPGTFPRLSGDAVSSLNDETTRLLGMSGSSGFNLGAASAHLARFGRNMGLLDTEVRQLTGLFAANVRNLRIFERETARMAAEVQRLTPQARRIFGGGAARTQLAGIDPVIAGAIASERNQRIQNGALGAAFIAPLITSSIGQYIPNDSLQGRRAGAAVGAIGDTAMFAGAGAFFGPQGAATGALLGGVVGVFKALRSWNDILPDLERNIQKLTESISKSADTHSRIIQLYQQLESATDPQVISRIQQELYNTALTLQPELMQGLRTGGRGGYERAFTEFNKRESQNLTLQDFSAFLETAKKQKLFNIPVDITRRPVTQRYLPPELTGEGKNISGEILNRLYSLGFGEILSNQDSLTILKDTFSKSRLKPSDIIAESFRGAGKTKEADILKESLGNFPNIVVKEVLNRALSSPNNKITPAQLFPRQPEVRIRGLTLAQAKDNALAAFIEREGISRFRTQGLIGSRIADESSLNNLRTQQELELGLRSPFISPIATENLRAGQAKSLIDNQLRRNQSQNVKGLSPVLSGFGSRNLTDIIQNISTDFPSNLKAFELLEGLQTGLNDFASKAKTGELNIGDLETFVTDARVPFLTGTSGLTDRNIEKQILSEIDSLLQSIRETADHEFELKEQSNADLKKIIEELLKKRQLLELFDTRSGVGGLFADGRISGSLLATRRAEIRARERTQDDFTGKIGFEHAFEAFTDQFRYNLKDAFADLEAATTDLAVTLKGSAKGALLDFANGTISASEAVKQFGVNVFQKLLERSVDFGINSLVGGIQAGASALYTSFGRANGGYIQKYGSGGKVYGGSGVRDDVPAMLSEGEYVIRKSSVNKYGEPLLKALNGGRVSTRLTNQYDYNNPLFPTAGSRNINPSLSNYAISNEDNPQNLIRMERESTLFQYLKDKADYEEAKSIALYNFELAKRQRVQAAYISAGIGIAGAGLSSGLQSYQASRPTTQAGQSFQSQVPQTRYYTPTQASRLYSRANGGLIKFANGGFAGGDTVPALLMGGEFVMNRSAVNKHGVDFFNRLNAGKFAAGGLVGGSSQNTSGGGDKLIENLNKLITSTDSLKESLEKSFNNPNNNRLAPQLSERGQAASASPAINIYNTINVSTNQNGETKANTETRTENNTTTAENNKKLGQQFESAILKVIIEQSRPGGLIYEQTKR